MAPGAVKPIVKAPFYTVEIHPGMLGTNGGPRLDRNGQVARFGGGVVGGLYAAGNTAANVFAGPIRAAGAPWATASCSASSPVATPPPNPPAPSDPGRHSHPKLAHHRAETARW